MSDKDRKFVLVSGIDTSVTLRDLITVFQQSSSIRFQVKRNMDPENMRAILEFDDPEKFDELHRKLEEDRIRLKGKIIKNSRNKKDEGHLGYSFGDFCEYIETRHKQKVQAHNANFLQIPQNPAPIKSEPSQSAPTSINDLVSQARQKSDMAGNASQGHLPTKPNGNFQDTDDRRICRHCNVDTPNLNQYESHRKGKKHIKAEQFYHQNRRYKPEIEKLIASGRALWQLQPNNGQSSASVKVPENRKTDMQKSMEIVLMNKNPEVWCPVCAIDLSSPVVAMTHYKGKKHITKCERGKQDGTLPAEVASKMEGIIEKLDEIGNKRKMGTDKGFNKRFKHDKWENQKQTRNQNYQQNYQEAYRQRDLNQRRNQLPPRQNKYIVEEGIQKQKEIYNRAGVTRPFDEPLPVECGEIKGVIIEEDGEEEVVGGSFHDKLDSLYQKNPHN